MVYRHEHFQLDDGQQIVFDSSGNELRVIGNDYLILEHLCRNKKANHQELAVLIGLGELYNGDHVAQLADHINGWIKNEVIKKNGDEYSLAGDVEETKLVFHADQEMQEPEHSEEKEPKKKLDLSWKMLIVIGAGLVVCVWLIKYIIDLIL